MKVEVDDKTIGDNEPCFIVAEVGLNHNGKLEQALELVRKAVEAGADAVKFQSYHIEDFAKKGSQNYQLFKELELTEEDFKDLYGYAKENGIIFFSTTLDLRYVDVLNKMNVPAFKIASSDLTFIPLLKEVAKTKKPVILSTGMGTIEEIAEAVNTITKEGSNDIILLHCISCYPAPFEEVNLRAMVTLKNTFDLLAGYSDHTLGIDVSIAAVALGAKVIEKHFTLNRGMKGPDHKLSANPEEFRRMVEGMRRVEKALGDGNKGPAECEKGSRTSGRRTEIKWKV